MISIDSKIYSGVACELMEKLDNQDGIFNGKIEFDTEQFSSFLLCTLLFERVNYQDFEVEYSRIEKIMPVWWDFKTYAENGEESNDFSWTEFKKFI
ncbi:MAG: hypothetical protein LIO79_05750 [Rikenellaceae bacterium]|nr:hypothetical protein [Rikenellaceae bacterium]